MAAIIKIRVHARWWVKAHHARRQEESRVIGAELHRLGALFATGPFYCKRRCKAEALPVHAAVIRAQLVVDHELRLFPSLWVLEDLIALGKGDIRGKHLCLAIRQVICHEIMGLEAEVMQAGAIEKRSGAEAVIVRQRGITKLV